MSAFHGTKRVSVLSERCLCRWTTQVTQAEILSRFWGLKGQIESHGLYKFKSHLERVFLLKSSLCTSGLNSLLEQSRQGVSLVLEAIRESRLAAFQPLLMGPSSFPIRNVARCSEEGFSGPDESKSRAKDETLAKVKRWFWR